MDVEFLLCTSLRVQGPCRSWGPTAGSQAAIPCHDPAPRSRFWRTPGGWVPTAPRGSAGRWRWPPPGASHARAHLEVGEVPGAVVILATRPGEGRPEVHLDQLPIRAEADVAEDPGKGSQDRSPPSLLCSHSPSPGSQWAQRPPFTGARVRQPLVGVTPPRCH